MARLLHLLQDVRLPRRALLIAGGLAVAALVALVWSGWRDRGPRPMSPKMALLVRQNHELAKLAVAAEKGTLLDFKGMLIVVDQVLVQDLLRAVTPLSADIGHGFLVRIDSAETVFGDGVALITLMGVATVSGASVGSPVIVYGAIDAVEVEPVSGVLRCSLSILGVEAQHSEVLGRNDPVGRLTAALAHGGLSLLLHSLEIPVRVEDRLDIPAVASKRLQIEPESIPMTVAANQIKVFGGRLWIFLDVALAPRAEPHQASE